MLMTGRMARWSSFLGLSALLWFLVIYAAPVLRDSIPEFRKYASVVEQNDIHAGAIYYTDVELTGNADINSRSTFEHTPMGPS
ncbi:hypothetical protein PCS_02926 [Desulfocurvibacter africanus PCS]|uniref:Uncharacterized protein n=1 Tax=Desulfocurvibacter africanus PCS TaxID=1262666 RepID=M5Q059_DESAF|nr:hypothetical protein [Desulfocurvibacter africanus]EMG36421.1 hypothetical protein PCS_02926 [Desulfocurvibacter africanus PCS]